MWSHFKYPFKTKSNKNGGLMLYKFCSFPKWSHYAAYMTYDKWISSCFICALRSSRQINCHSVNTFLDFQVFVLKKTFLRFQLYFETLQNCSLVFLQINHFKTLFLFVFLPLWKLWYFQLIAHRDLNWRRCKTIRKLKSRIMKFHYCSPFSQFMIM